MNKTFSLAGATVAVLLATSSAFAVGTYNYDAIYNVLGSRSVPRAASHVVVQPGALGRYIALYRGRTTQDPCMHPYSHADEGNCNGAGGSSGGGSSSGGGGSSSGGGAR